MSTIAARLLGKLPGSAYVRGTPGGGVYPLLTRISCGADVLEWVTTALRDRPDQKQFHGEAPANIQSRIDASVRHSLDLVVSIE